MSLLFSIFRAVRFAARVVRTITLTLGIVSVARRYAR